MHQSGWEAFDGEDSIATAETVGASGLSSASAAPSSVMFWVLLLLASSVFAPCVLVPVWKDYQAIVLARLVEEQAVAHMRSDVDRLERHLDGLRNDPAVIARVARRDLAYTSRRETVVLVDVASPRVDTASAGSVETIQDVEPPPWMRRVLTWLPFADRADVFANSATRTTLILLSGGLVVAAFWLFPPRRRRDLIVACAVDDSQRAIR